MGDQGRHRGQEDQLTGGIRRRQQADNESFTRPEPAPGDIRRQKPADESRRQPDEDTPQQNELPGVTHRGSHHHGDGCDGKRQRDRAACAEAVHYRRSEGADCAEQQKVDPEGEGDRRS